MAVCLITGGAGFIGSHLAEALVARGDTVRVLDNFSAGTLANLASVGDRIEVIAEDLNDREILQRAMRDVAYVFHFMAPGFDTPKGLEMSPAKWANAPDTFNVLDAAKAAKVRRVIFASSGLVYGPRSADELKESEPTVPAWPIGFAKQTAENLCAGFTLLYGLETVCLRFFNVYGPRQSLATPYASAIPSILGSMLAGQNPVIADNPFDQQDFLYIDDAVHATLLAAEAPRVAGKAYNIARGRSTSLVQVVNLANEILGTHYQPIFTNLRPSGELMRTVSITRAEAEIGFCPSTDLKLGLSRFISFLQLQSPAPHPLPVDSEAAGLKPPHFLTRAQASSPAAGAKQNDNATADGH